jgi:cytochrome c-type biogenesis protein CcmH
MKSAASMPAVLPPLPSRRCLLALVSAGVGVRGRVELHFSLHRRSSTPPLTLALSCRPRLRKHAQAVPAADRMRSETPPAPRKGRGDLAERVMAFFTSAVVCMSFAHGQSTNDPALEARVKALSSELRCLVCQNQTVEDSSSPVARDMKDQVRTQLAAGKSEAEVKIYMTDRFGDFVLYKPPLKATTIVLWAGPFIALFFAGLLLVRRLRRSSVATDTGLGTGVDALSETDRARARALLHNNAEGATKP